MKRLVTAMCIMLMAGGLNAQGPYQPDENTVVLFHMDECDGDTAFDASIWEHHGAFDPIDGPNWETNGRFDCCLSLDGQNDSVRANFTDMSFTSGPYTVEAWILLNSLPTTQYHSVVCMYSQEQQIPLAVMPDGRVLFRVAENNLHDYAELFSLSTLQVGEWYHIAGVYDGANILIHINGILDNSTVLGFQPEALARNALDIGKIRKENLDDPWHSNWFDGLIDEVRISSVARTFNSLLLPSVAVHSCGFDECLVQPVDVSVIAPLKGMAIPIEFPAEITICSLSTEGLVTDNWNRPYEEINESSFFISLADMSGEQIDVGQTTILNIFYTYDSLDCRVDQTFSWDTTFYDDPNKHLAFTDTMFSTINPSFDYDRDSSTILGYVPGDANGDGTGPDITDLVYLVDYMFLGGPVPPCMLWVDVNGDCGFDISDLVKLVNYMFTGGPALECGCSDPNNEVPKLAQHESIYLNATHDGSQTTIHIDSDYDLLGIQLELVGVGSNKPTSLMDNDLELVYGSDDGPVKVGLFDMEGVVSIPSGEKDILVIEGEYEIVSATVADRSFTSLTPTIGAKVETVVPHVYSLNQNFPNPFNPVTSISFSLAEPGFAKLEVYNVMGQKVTTLVDGSLEAGHHAIEWDGSGISSGVYFYRLTTDSFTDTRKMILLK